jgi:hypothetical protein
MAIKGHTRIELTNVETGEVEVHEDNNMVTNALSKLLGNYGWFANNAVYDLMDRKDDNSSVIKRLTGGIMLFNSAIAENPEVINSPIGVSVVGCGSQTAYNGENIMAGSYNQSESGWTENGGYRHVWDFTTSQANGEIACACLTTASGGKITEGTFPLSYDYYYGEGVNTEDEILFNSTRNPFIYLKVNDDFETGYYPLLFADGINNRVILPNTYQEMKEYQHGGTGSDTYEEFKNSVFYKKSIDLALYRFGFSNFSIFDKPVEAIASDLLEIKTVEMPSGLKAIFTQEMLDDYTYHWRVGSVCDEDNIYIILYPSMMDSQSILNGEKAYIWEINATTFDSNYYEFHNSLNEDIFIFDFNENSLHYSFAICGDYILCVGADTSCVYIIKKDNSNDFEIIKYPDDDSFIGELSFQGKMFSNNGKFIVDNGVESYKVVDPVTKIAKFKNINYDLTMLEGVGQYVKLMKVKGTHWFISASWVQEEYGNKFVYIGNFIDPTLLVTINNLETPVQKTSAQTMKVTYVLTQE